MKLKKISALFLNFIIVNSLMAQECNDVPLVDVGGFTISGSKTEILAENKFTEYSLQLGEVEVIDKITKLITSVNPNPRGSESPKALATNIYNAAEAYGVDPIILAAKVWQESGQFNADIVASGGDTGLTQMTGNGLDEITEQYSKINSRNKSERQVGNVLAELSGQYFKKKSSTKNWVDWVITKTNSQKKSTLVQSPSYALASGASLLKIYLAVNKGSYKKAIAQFNGGGTSGYYGKVTDKAELLKKMSANCGLSESTLDTLDAICQITGSESGCNAIVNEIIPNKPKQYDI
jgi:hypothetical protein